MSDIFVALRLRVILDQLPIAVFLMSEIYQARSPDGGNQNFSSQARWL